MSNLIERRQGKSLDATGNRDEDMAATFLGQFAAGSNTLRSYARPVRWLLQECSAHGACFADLSIRDAQTFRNRILETRSARTGKSPSPATVNYYISTLAGFFDWMVRLNYLRSNPFSGLKPLPKITAKGPVERYLDTEQIKLVWQAVLAMPEATKAQIRLKSSVRWMVAVLLKGCLRRSEVVSLKIGDFRLDRKRFGLHVRGKGGVEATVPLPYALKEELELYCEAYHGRPVNDCLDEPVLGGYSASGGAITDDALYKRMKRLFGQALLLVSPGDSESIRKLRIASTHWLRHSGATAIVNSTDINTAQLILRHSEIGTTSRYVHKTMDQAYKAVQDVDFGV